VAALHDLGIRVIGVANTALTPIPCRYEIRRENALRTILRQWRTVGLTSTVVVAEPRGRSAVNEERYRGLSEDESLPSKAIILRKLN
jgi:hypothetical protein